MLPLLLEMAPVSAPHTQVAHRQSLDAALAVLSALRGKWLFPPLRVRPDPNTAFISSRSYFLTMLYSLQSETLFFHVDGELLGIEVIPKMSSFPGA